MGDAILERAVILTLVPREPRFAVRLPLRMSREGAAPFQVALPKAFHDRLRTEIAGSLNHALIAMARQALAWLDAEQATLFVELAKDPLSSRDRSAITDHDRRDMWTYPHRMFSELRREGSVVVALDGRPSRFGVVFVQIGLPPDLQERLHEQGVGSVGQLLVYLARYAFMRLEAASLSLHVNQATAPSASPSPQPDMPKSDHRFKLCTVGEMVKILSTYPPETPLLPRQTDRDVENRSLVISERYDVEGKLIGIVVAADPDVSTHPEQPKV